MLNDFFTVEMLLGLGILAVPTACITYFIYAVAKVVPSARPVPFFPHGVHGWLLVFVATIVLSVIVTAFNALGMIASMSEQGEIYWSALSPAIVTLGLYFYCLWIIARKRAPFVVKHAIVILWVVGPISVLLMSFTFGITFETESVLRACSYAMVWTLYFLFSKRVACTYGTKAVDSYIEVARQVAEAQKKKDAQATEEK